MGLARGKRVSGALSASVFCLLLIGQAGHADTRQSKKDIAACSARIIETIPKSNIGLPSRLAQEGDVYVILTCGAAYVDARVLALTSVAPSELGRAVERACAGTPMAGRPVEWSAGKQYSAARVVYSRGRYGTRESTLSFPVGRILAGVRAQGFMPHVLLRIPKYADTSDLESAKYGSPNYRWYNATDIEPGRRLTVHARLGLLPWALGFLISFFVPCMSFLAIASAVLLGRSKRLPIQARRKLYPKLVRYPIFGGIMVHVPFFFWYIRSRQMMEACDLWQGSATPEKIVRLALLAYPVIFLLLPIAVVVERKLYGPAEGETAPPLSPEERKVTKRASLLSLLPVLVGLALVVANPFDRSRQLAPNRVWFVVSMVLMFIGPAIVSSRIGKKLRFYAPADPDLQNRATRIAGQLGVKFREISVLDSPFGRRYANAAAHTNGRILVTRKLLDEFSAEELEFALAHEMSHLKRRDVPKQLGVFILGLVMLHSPILARLANVHFRSYPLLVALVFGPALLGFCIIFGGMRWITRKREYSADRAALELTRNLSAAESVLAKLVRFSPMPYLHEVEDLATHPKVSKRIASLRRIAAEIHVA